MLVECSNCGAPLSVGAREEITTCAYCGKSSRVQELHTVAQQNPAAWKPPKEWSPPEGVNAPTGVPLPYRTQNKGIGCLIGGSVILVFMAVAVISLVQTLNQADPQKQSVLLAALAPPWSGDEPFECSLNEIVEIREKTVVFDQRTAFTVTQNCQVHIIDCDVTAYAGIAADGNRKVRIENSVFRTVGPAIEAGGNRRIEVVNSRLVSSETVAIIANENAHVTVTGGTIEGAPTATQSEGNGRVEHRGGEVVDREVDVDSTVH